MRKRSPRAATPTERLCVYPQFMDPEWLEQGVLDVIKLRFWSFIPRRGSGRRTDRSIRLELVPGAVAKGRDGRRLSPAELSALFAETRPEAIEDIRQAADELRAELAGDTVTFVVNRNINVSNICVVGCAFCGFGQGRRSPDAYEHSRDEFARRVLEAVEFGATEICMQSGIHPDWTLEDYALAAAGEGAGARDPPARLLADGDRSPGSGPAAARGLRPPQGRGPRIDAGDGRRGPPRRRTRADLTRSCRWPAGWRSSRRRTPRACARPPP